jgi:hypothetical protein
MLLCVVVAQECSELYKVRLDSELWNNNLKTSVIFLKFSGNRIVKRLNATHSHVIRALRCTELYTNIYPTFLDNITY